MREQGPLFRPQADQAEQLRHPVIALGRVAYLQLVQRLPHDAAGPDPWIERGIGILENNLHLAPLKAQFLALQGADIHIAQADPSPGNMHQPHNRERGGGLAGTAFAHQTEGFAPGHGKIDAVDGVDARRLAEGKPFLLAEMDLQILNPQQNIAPRVHPG